MSQHDTFSPSSENMMRLGIVTEADRASCSPLQQNSILCCLRYEWASVIDGETSHTRDMAVQIQQRVKLSYDLSGVLLLLSAFDRANCRDSIAKSESGMARKSGFQNPGRTGFVAIAIIAICVTFE